MQRDAVETIFTTLSGQPLRVWLDPTLPSSPDLRPLLISHGASISDSHIAADVNILVIHPTSKEVFDEYCNPVWLTMSQRLRYQRLVRTGAVDEGLRRKVMVSEEWVKMSVEAGRVLGEEDDWGGCRKGG